MLPVSVVLQLLLVGMSGLLQGDQGPVLQLLVVPVPLLGGCSQLHLGKVMAVQGALVIHLREDRQVCRLSSLMRKQPGGLRSSPKQDYFGGGSRKAAVCGA